MASVDETVREAILCYPLTCPNRFAVLHHIFCVIGNGYSWVDGEAVINDYGRPRVHWTSETSEIETELKATAPNVASLLEEHFRDLYASTAVVVAEVDTRMFDLTNTTGRGIYPQSDYAMLFNLPEDIKDDWREAADWMREYASNNGWTF